MEPALESATDSLPLAERAPTAARPPRVGDLLAGRFRLLEVLGWGGSGTVFLAEDGALRCPVALKVLHPERLTREGFARLRREVLLARDLPSSRLLRVYGVERADGHAFLTMEPAAGSLAEELRQGPLPIERAIGRAGELLEALAALHGAGVVHRDVKPANLLLSAGGELKLGDFGLAFAPAGELTRLTVQGDALGTLNYAAPEQVLGQKVDARADLFSAGVVLYELLTGELPHGAGSHFTSLVRHLSREPPDPRARRPEVPRWLSRLTRRLLAPRPRDRYPTAAAALSDLRWRRAGLEPRSLRRLAGALGLAALAGVGAWQLSQGLARRFDRVVGSGPMAIQAVTTKGEVLWRKENVVPTHNFVPVRWGRRRALAAILSSPSDYVSREARLLHLLDPERGVDLDAMELPSAGETFGGFAASYGFEIQGLDLDGDGEAELVVSFIHVPLYPSFQVLVEPRLQRSRVIFVSSGHHRPMGALDLDGDGRSELLLGGINNRLGWHLGLGALAIEPPVNAAPESASWPGPAASPELRRGAITTSANLLWYTLGPPQGHARLEHLAIDRPNRRLDLTFTNGNRWQLDFDGFMAMPGPPTSTGERRERRRASFEELREGMRLSELGEHAAAVEQLRQAGDDARRAGEPYLAAFATRLRARELVALGSHAAAEALYEPLRDGDNGDEIALDAARAFHRAGELERAVTWYERAVRLNTQVGSGRGLYETLEGLFFALLELGDAERLVATADRIIAATEDADPMLANYRAVARWLVGRPAAEISVVMGSPDLLRYWSYELRRAAGESPGTLLPAVRAELPRQTEGQTLLMSLEAVLLAQTGEREAARRRMGEAWGRALQGQSEDLALRAHLPLLRRRLLELTGKGRAPGPSSGPGTSAPAR